MTLAEMQRKIQGLEEEKNRLEGRIAHGLESIQEDFGVSTLEEAQAELARLSEQEESAKARLDILTKELEALTDWDSL